MRKNNKENVKTENMEKKLSMTYADIIPQLFDTSHTQFQQIFILLLNFLFSMHMNIYHFK